ncbi:MAG: sulfatase [Bacteroidota bacterium]
MKQIYKSSLFLLAILFSSITLCIAQDSISSTPNFLFLICEDISPYLSFYGDRTAKTPNLDKLAKESLIYDNAFTTVGVCAPSRSTMITGMYPVSIGTHNMRTGKSYSGWGFRAYTKLKKTQRDQKNIPFSMYSAVVPPEVKCFTKFMREAGYYCTNQGKSDFQFDSPLSAWDENGKGHYKNREDGQPFLSMLNFGVTHESRIWIKSEDSLRIDPDKVNLPSYIPDFEQSRIDYARNYSNIEELDAQMGRAIKELKASGEYENTYIIFMSDHGGPLPRGKRLIYDSGLKVPFMVRFPNQQKVGRTDQLISFVDIAPTILSLAGVDVPDYLQGKAFLGKQEGADNEYVFGSRDRFDEFYDRSRSIRNKNFLLVKNYYLDQPLYLDLKYRKQIPFMNEFLRMRDNGELNETQMLWFNPSKPKIEFYDVVVDPEQINNLAHLPQYQDEIKTMLAELESWQKRVDDKGAIPEADLLLGMWPDMIQPRTAEPKVELVDKAYEAICETDGADIVYQYSESVDTITTLDHWKTYTKPLEKRNGTYLHVRATRIGYADSRSIIIKM